MGVGSEERKFVVHDSPCKWLLLKRCFLGDPIGKCALDASRVHTRRDA